jgi:hypothetical protein
VSEIDWRDLMKRYIQHVEECEGVHFLGYDHAPVDVEWANEAEREALTKLRDEVDAEHQSAA